MIYHMINKAVIILFHCWRHRTRI